MNTNFVEHKEFLVTFPDGYTVKRTTLPDAITSAYLGSNQGDTLVISNQFGSMEVKFK